MSTLAIISDVHGNLGALRAVLADADARGVARVIALGDLVGYNAESDACVAALRARGVASVAGNHDLIAIGALGFERCADKPAFALRRTRRTLTDATRGFLAALPATLALSDETVAIHGGVDDVCEYLFTPERVAANAARLARRDARAKVCFFGHTHDARVYALAHGVAEPVAVQPGVRVRLDGRGRRYFVNPGAVDAARKREPRRAEYALFDPEARTVEFVSVHYDHAAAEARARAAGYRMDRTDELLYAAAGLARRARQYALRRVSGLLGARDGRPPE